MLAHGREMVSAQCLLPLVDAGESVSRQCLETKRNYSYPARPEPTETRSFPGLYVAL
jgi:hypothetical protein